MHGYTASWTVRQLEQRIRRAQLAPQPSLPTLAEFADHLAGYAGVIGDIDQQRWPGEEWQTDPLLT